MARKPSSDTEEFRSFTLTNRSGGGPTVWDSAVQTGISSCTGSRGGMEASAAHAAGAPAGGELRASRWGD